MSYLEQMAKFDEENLPTLDEVVMGALELFIANPPSKLDISEFKKPLIAGSGNAIVTARNIFSKTDAIFCDETQIDEYLDKDIDGLIICSSSGDKHAIVFAQKAKNKGIKTKLLTCNPKAGTIDIIGLENTVITLKNREPYTYNTSTYMGWMFAVTGEKPQEIKDFIEKEIDSKLKTIDFSKYKAYLMVTPDKLGGINEMFVRKFFELFGRHLARDVFTFEQVKHSITVHPCDGELAFSFGEGDFYFVGDRINFPLPVKSDLATMMTIGYYVIGKIQKSIPPYYKNNIKTYLENTGKSEFGKGLKVIVD
ncbi:hypothetical protein EOM39_05885 [Candidatus Gracilibacteria bacterium]|nr:hypothetical protein [Candidatus Gracilibacteria bacterium]